MQEIMVVPISKEELNHVIRDAVEEALRKKQKLDKERELLDAKGLCDWLGISISSLNKWKSKNAIPFRKMGRRVFFEKAEVMKALEHSNYSRIKELRGE